MLVMTQFLGKKIRRGIESFLPLHRDRNNVELFNSIIYNEKF